MDTIELESAVKVVLQSEGENSTMMNWYSCLCKNHIWPENGEMREQPF